MTPITPRAEVDSFPATIANEATAIGTAAHGPGLLRPGLRHPQAEYSFFWGVIPQAFRRWAVTLLGVAPAGLSILPPGPLLARSRATMMLKRLSAGNAVRSPESRVSQAPLTLRFYDPTEGRILLDGVDTREYQLEHLRNQFAVVLQDPVLFVRTIGENIAYGRPGASEEEVEAAARKANAHDFIAALPLGYESMVGERGMTLSGGERQRIALARAFLKDAPILILDEPTSSLDRQTERLILDALERLMRGRTTFLIAHREWTLEECDQLLTLDGGQAPRWETGYRGARRSHGGGAFCSLTDFSRLPSMSLRIVVTGLIGSIPLPGLTLHYLQYVLAIRQLGHDVLYLEDTGTWHYDPASDQMVDAPGRSVSYLRQVMNRHGLEDRWSFVDVKDTQHGCVGDRLDDFIQTADLFINVTGAGLLRDQYMRIPHRAYVDTDPGYVQFRAASGSVKDRRHLEAHTCHFTFGGNVGRPECEIPTLGLAWHPTVQPLCLELWPCATIPPPASAVFTTVLKWQSYDAVVFEGRTYGGKREEFEKFQTLPARSGKTFRVVTGTSPDETLTALGWSCGADANVGSTVSGYCDFIRNSKAEWSIAKNGYVRSRGGWFGDRSASYLASGRPVVMQSTGYETWLPVGEGVLTFHDMQSALEALSDVDGRLEQHCHAARALAESKFAAGRVVAALIETAMRGE